VFIALGLVIVFGSIFVGYTMHGGAIAVLIQVSEFIIIGGAGFGALLIANKPAVVKQMMRDVIALLKPNPFNRAAYTELLQVLFEIFYAARRDGLVGIESHIESPQTSELFRKYPKFCANHHAVDFLSDTMKVLLTGAVEDHHLSEILDLDLERHHSQSLAVPGALHRVADAMPGFGIVAAVLGVIITMGHIGGSPEEIGHSVAAALVGTFLGILLAYGVLSPLASAVENRAHGEDSYMKCIRTAVLSFARGDPPITSVEFARRNIEPEDRPSFAELENLTRKRNKAA
jgi:chemotaxis protein MotA